MHFEGTQQIKAPAQQVWQFVLDPNKVAECAPGFKSMDILGPDHFKPTLAVGIGAVKATFTLDVTLEDVRKPDHAAMRGRGSAGGSAVDMKAAMDLKALSEEETQMNWVADVNVSGTLASVGARLLEGTAHRLTAKFFDCFREKLEAANA
ncbi:MAG TPA: carbon monoxide dehydrogenase subunit G [Ktedonobacterales bacterium]